MNATAQLVAIQKQEEIEELHRQDRLKTREINVLVIENRMLRAALEKIRDHEGWDDNNCAMKPSEWREQLQEISRAALETKA